MALDEFTFPEVQSFGNFRGSMAWCSQSGEHVTDLRSFLRLGTVRLLDCSNLDPNVHDSDMNGLKFDICSFANNVKLVASIYCYDRSGWGICVEAAILYKYRSNYVRPTQGRPPALGGPGTTSTAFYCGYADAKERGIKVFCSTMYPLSTQVAPGVTHPSTIAFFFAIPSYTFLWGRHCYFSNISEGNTTKIYYDNEQRDNENYPSDFYNSPDRDSTIIYKWYFDSIDAVVSDLNNFAPITKNEVLQKDDLDEPVQDSDPSEPGGGSGNYDPNSDPIDFPSLPTSGALESGAVKAFLVSETTLLQLFNKLWNSNLFDIETFQKLVDNPMDCIISLHCIPVQPHTATNPDNIVIGSFDTEILAQPVDNQYLTIDCGSLNLKEFWGSALDYNPYTRVAIYLPFIGVKDLNTDDVMNNIVHVKYNLDVLTGECLANIKCGSSVLYKFNGNLKQDIPLTARTADFLRNSLQGGLTAAGGIGMGTAVGGVVGAAIGASAVASGAGSVVGSKYITTHSGSLAGSVGLLDDFRPYLILHRPIQSLANNFKTFKGYPSNITATLSSVTGYTEVEYINLQNIPNATDSEMDEIKSLLRGGVII